MEPEVKAALIENGAKVLSDVMRLTLLRPVARMPEQVITQEPPRPQPAPAPSYVKVIPEIESKPAIKSLDKPQARQDLDYRFECCLKHLGGASVLLKEAYQRANDEGIGDGTSEKIMEAMNEHSGMEADLEKMLDMTEVKPLVDRILSGERAFRAAAWKARLPVGGGTKEDIADARTWNDIMMQEVLAQAKKTPGQTCVAQGM